MSCHYINFKYFLWIWFLKNCKLKFGSWTYDAASVDIVPEAPSANLLEYQQNGEWDLIDFPCKQNKKSYVCCPNPFTDVTCTLQIRRRTKYYWINLIIPCMLITGMDWFLNCKDSVTLFNFPSYLSRNAWKADARQVAAKIAQFNNWT